jgi:hypothetical protein
VRGTRVQKLRCDEVELFDPEVWEAAQLATMEQDGAATVWVPGTIECLSTMHVPYGLMYRMVGMLDRDRETERRRDGVARSRLAGVPARRTARCSSGA